MKTLAALIIGAIILLAHAGTATTFLKTNITNKIDQTAKR